MFWVGHDRYKGSEGQALHRSWSSEGHRGGQEETWATPVVLQQLCPPCHWPSVIHLVTELTSLVPQLEASW